MMNPAQRLGGKEDFVWELESAELIFIWMYILLAVGELHAIVIGCFKLETKPDAIKTKKNPFHFYCLLHRS